MGITITEGQGDQLKPFTPLQRAELLNAIVDRLDADEADAEEMVTTLQDIFMGVEEVDDMSLGSIRRSFCYSMESIRILGFRKETEKETGKRTFFWHIRWDNLEVKPKKPKEEGDVYAGLPQKAWAHGSKPPTTT